MAIDFFVHGTGWHQGDLVDLLALYVTRWNGMLTKLDNDAGVADTNYNALWALALPATIQTVDPKCIRENGALATFAKSLIDNMTGANAKLDADATVTDTNYGALWNLAQVAHTEIDSIKQNGLYNGCLIRLLDNWRLSMNGILLKLDADAGVTDTTYTSLWSITDQVDENGTVARVA